MGLGIANTPYNTTDNRATNKQEQKHEILSTNIYLLVLSIAILFGMLCCVVVGGWRPVPRKQNAGLALYACGVFVSVLVVVPPTVWDNSNPCR